MKFIFNLEENRTMKSLLQPVFSHKDVNLINIHLLLFKKKKVKYTCSKNNKCCEDTIKCYECNCMYMQYNGHCSQGMKFSFSKARFKSVCLFESLKLSL